MCFQLTLVHRHSSHLSTAPKSTPADPPYRRRAAPAATFSVLSICLAVPSSDPTPMSVDSDAHSHADKLRSPGGRAARLTPTLCCCQVPLTPFTLRFYRITGTLSPGPLPHAQQVTIYSNAAAWQCLECVRREAATRTWSPGYNEACLPSEWYSDSCCRICTSSWRLCRIKSRRG